MSTRGSAGMTLIEIMMVVVVIGILSAMAVPNMARYAEDLRVKGAARAVADALLVARAEAIRTGSNHFVAFQSSLGAADPIAVVNDGPAATANCSIDAGETRHRVPAAPDVSWGTSAGLANGTPAPSDSGLAVASVETGSSFTDASLNPASGASWVLFQPDGLPRLFTPGGGACAAIGLAGQGGGAIYLTNTRRDYAVVLSNLGTVRVHVWEPHTGAWAQ